MFAPLLVALVVTSIGAGCDRKPSESVASTPAPADTTAAASSSSVPVDQLLAELTQAVRKYAMEKQTVPRSLDELVAAGYLRGLPRAPDGKRFGISKELKVYLH